MNKKILFADLVLLLLNVLWGYCFLAIKDVLNELKPFQIIALRFLIPSIILVPIYFNSFLKLSKTDLRNFLFTGLALGLGFSFQTLGMQFSSPSKAGVFTGMLVVFVPFVYYFVSKKRISNRILIGTIISFFGLGLFSLNDIKSYFFQMGDFLLISCAIIYAVHIVLNDFTFHKNPNINENSFASFQILMSGLIGFVFSLSFEKIPSSISVKSIYLILFLSFFGSFLAYFIQTWAQKISPPSHVGILLCTESIFACVFSYFLLNEVFGLEKILGTIILSIGILLISYPSK